MREKRAGKQGGAGKAGRDRESRQRSGKQDENGKSGAQDSARSMRDAPGTATADIDTPVAVDAHSSAFLARYGGGEALLLLLQRGVARVRTARQHPLLQIQHCALAPPLPRTDATSLLLADVAFRHCPRGDACRGIMVVLVATVE